MGRNYHVVIIGGGFAGLAAADLLTRHKLAVLVVDENVHTGGQLLRKMLRSPGEVTLSEPDPLKRVGYRLVDRIHGQGLQLMNRAQVLGIYPERQLCIEDRLGRILDLKAEFIICATGAREKFLPFKGWTLPGVISTGAAQILIKSSGILPARETLIGGCGPLLIVLANEILMNNGRILSVLDQSLPRDKIGLLKLCRHHLPKLIEGARYFFKLLLSRVPVRQSTGIVEARGTHRLEAVVTARVDARGQAIAGTETTYQTDCLAIGYGFAPNIELPQQAGCAIEYHLEKGGWTVGVDDYMETSVENLYAAGETTGIAGAKKSYIEGKIAALSILQKLGIGDANARQRQLISLQRLWQHQRQYGKFLNLLCHIPAASYAAISDDTIICRCEDVTMGEIRKKLSNGFTTMGSLKKASRSGMGNCQGRICGPILHDILAAYTRKSPTQIGPLSIRPPIKAVPLEALANLDIDD